MNTIELKNTLKNIASNQTKYDAATTDSIISVIINYYNVTDTSYDTIEEIDGLRVVENVEQMRIQLLFDGKPCEETRTLLKSYGFKWSPKNMAWQRVLNNNGKYAAGKVIEKLKEQQAE